MTTNTGGVTSEKPGIEGLLEQGRTFMLQKDQTAEAQHKMVRDTLGGLMTPVLPPFYRIFMSGIIPKAEWVPEDLRGKQIGPLGFYAPFLTSFVTPTFFAFLVGPSYPNRRKDGQPGGLVVEKCKFLQESGCKGKYTYVVSVLGGVISPQFFSFISDFWFGCSHSALQVSASISANCPPSSFLRMSLV